MKVLIQWRILTTKKSLLLPGNSFLSYLCPHQDSHRITRDLQYKPSLKNHKFILGPKPQRTEPDWRKRD